MPRSPGLGRLDDGAVAEDAQDVAAAVLPVIGGEARFA